MATSKIQKNKAGIFGVPDVAITDISDQVLSERVNSVQRLKYSVHNGICYLDISGIKFTAAAKGSDVAITNDVLPTCQRVSAVTTYIDGDEYPIYISISANQKRLNVNGVKDANLSATHYATLAYPVSSL